MMQCSQLLATDFAVLLLGMVDWVFRLASELESLMCYCFSYMNRFAMAIHCDRECLQDALGKLLHDIVYNILH